MTRTSLIVAAAFAGFALSAAQAAVPPSATPAAGTSTTTLAMGPGPDWCAPQNTDEDSADPSQQTGRCEKVAWHRYQ